MEVKVTGYNVKKGSRVRTRQDIPTGKFGSLSNIREGVYGDVVSNGFENTQLKVNFWTYSHGNQMLTFNSLSAPEYLTTEVYI